MSEFIVSVPDEAAEYFIARFGLDGTKMMGYDLMGEIVRCRYCKHHHEGECMMSDGMGDFKRWYVDDDDYCSDGEVSADE